MNTEPKIPKKMEPKTTDPVASAGISFSGAVSERSESKYSVEITW